jgi:hypothetical protein
MLKRLLSRKKKGSTVSTDDIDFSGYTYFKEIHPNVFRRRPILVAGAFGNSLEERERREISCAGGIIEPPTIIANPGDGDKELLSHAWSIYREKLESKGIVLPTKSD